MTRSGDSTVNVSTSSEGMSSDTENARQESSIDIRDRYKY